MYLKYPWMIENNFLTYILQILEEIKGFFLPLSQNQESESDWDQNGLLEVIWSKSPLKQGHLKLAV